MTAASFSGCRRKARRKTLACDAVGCSIYRMAGALKKIRKLVVPQERRRAAWKRLVGPETLVSTAHGRFFVSTSDDVIGKNIFVRGDFDHASFERLLSLIPGRYHTFVDVGANIGTHTIYALNSGRFSRAACFEPGPDNFRLLEKNTSVNGYADRCDLYPFALGASEGVMTFELSGDNHGDHRLKTNDAPGQYGEHLRATMAVEVRCLDGFGFQPDQCFLHVDVQGAEMFVMDGAANFLQECRSMYSEFWPYGLERNQSLNRYVETVKSCFNFFYDLDNKTEKRSINEFDRLVDQYGFDTIGTDILFVR